MMFCVTARWPMQQEVTDIEDLGNYAAVVKMRRRVGTKVGTAWQSAQLKLRQADGIRATSRQT